MDLKDQIDDQAYSDGLAFRRIREDEDAWGALTRLIGRMHDDAIRQWSDEPSGGERTKKWLKGSREMCQALVPAIEQMIRDSEDVIAEKKDMEEAARSPAADGVGSGDLAIA